MSSVHLPLQECLWKQGLGLFYPCLCEDPQLSPNSVWKIKGQIMSVEQTKSSKLQEEELEALNLDFIKEREMMVSEAGPMGQIKEGIRDLWTQMGFLYEWTGYPQWRPFLLYFILVLIWVGISISNMNEEHL